MDLFPEQVEEKGKQPLKTAAKISLTILLLFMISQFLAIYQTIYQLKGPLVPGYTIGEINKQFVFKAFTGSVISLIALILYFFKQYIVIVMLVILTLIITRFILIKPMNDFELMFF